MEANVVQCVHVNIDHVIKLILVATCTLFVQVMH